VPKSEKDSFGPFKWRREGIPGIALRFTCRNARAMSGAPQQVNFHAGCGAQELLSGLALRAGTGPLRRLVGLHALVDAAREALPIQRTICRRPASYIAALPRAEETGPESYFTPDGWMKLELGRVEIPSHGKDRNVVIVNLHRPDAFGDAQRAYAINIEQERTFRYVLSSRWMRTGRSCSSTINGMTKNPAVRWFVPDSTRSLDISREACSPRSMWLVIQKQDAALSQVREWDDDVQGLHVRSDAEWKAGIFRARNTSCPASCR
jgi:hypothetical protein